ncbi:cellulase (glycosyl hydrolase family 5) [Labedella gwakjiensis]|uniref:Exo-1,3-beta-glucanase D n=2 Tax=Labedella gwakjiensis TaxID=390269 RepID=A0A2P8GTJ1_9MICO|nr:cellulase (glycosyl hydrolase family 5) [Labedella gwakjiensis]
MRIGAHMKKDTVTIPPTGFVHTSGTEIVDGAGRRLLLRGVGLGNWLLAEGYMWRFGDELASPRQIEARIEGLVGAERAAEFWRTFRARYVTEADIALIAESGFDHVRLPINARGVMDDDGVFLEDGFAHIDDAIDWCERHGLWILLDLHGAPGGQTGTNIDDSPNGVPELFMDERYRALTVRLWTEIARRYRSRTAVLGYDLLNEPLPNEWHDRYADDLVTLYAELTSAVRAVDPDHLIMYEGTRWATDWSIFDRVEDGNAVLQFHRYWCPPDRSSIVEYLDARDRLGVPIYMGEGGENTPEWIYSATRLYERHGIGWNFWPWKKLETRTSPLSVSAPEGWSRITDPADALEPEAAWTILLDMLDRIRVERCEWRAPVVDALFGRLPLDLPAWGGGADGPAWSDIPEGMWHHTAGEPYATDEHVSVHLPTGARLEFPLASEPSSWVVRSSDDGAVDVAWVDDRLVATARRAVTVTGMRVEV